MTWVAVAIGGSALIGGASSIAGAKSQAKGAKKGADLQMQQFETLNRQQQPFIQSGYGAMGKLNTLLGIGARPMSGGGGMPAPQGGGGNFGQTYRPKPNGGMQQIISSGPKMAPQPMRPMGGSRLRQILMLRAMNGDTEAARIAESM